MLKKYIFTKLKKLKIKKLNYLFNQFEIYQTKKREQDKKELIKQFKKVGSGFNLGKDYFIYNPEFMEFGNGFSARDRFRIEAIKEYEGAFFTPQIKIGNNVIFNFDIHIGCSNLIEIGDNCLFGSRIYITDHHHGDTSDGMKNIIVKNRPLISKGSVCIKDNVWVGEGVAIMPNVTIGENSIVASNAVVTKNIPANSVVAGIPATIIKILS